MAITWDNRFCVGHELIDAQHQQLITYYNDFSTACSAGKGKDEISRLFGFLDSYVLEHFAEEEALMQKHGYPKAPMHRVAHMELTRSLRELRNQLQGNQVPLSVVIDASRMLMKWVLDHIGKEDVALSGYLAKS
ncbi:MAG: hemerythrin [Desulfuromonas sp.]|nr:MAG: hemerythrin [Desulfuromonas sp.]